MFKDAVETGAGERPLKRPAQGIDPAFSIAATRPRVTRLYVYHWQGRVGDHFDAGMARPDGTLRPSYRRLVAHVTGQSRATIASPAIPAPRWKATWSSAKPSLLRIKVTCRAGGRRCSGTVTVRIHDRKVVTRRYPTTARRTTQTLRVSVPRMLRARLRRAQRPRVVLTVRASAPAAVTSRVTLEVRRPLRSE